MEQEQEIFNYYLPSEIIINEIFSRLPAQSIAISKCVCRSWLDLLDEDGSPTALAVLAEKTESFSRCTVFDLKDEIDAESSRHDRRYIHPTKSIFPHGVEVWGSANGLLFLKKLHGYYMYICNPTTREYIELLRCLSPYGLASYGFGASKISGQYKVIWINHLTDDCHVYTLGTGSWRRVEVPRPPFFIYGPQNHGAFINGNLHWPVRDIEGTLWISCFDLETDSLCGYLVPRDIKQLENIKVSTLNGCLCLCDHTFKRDGIIGIWLMKEYGVEKSWTKKYVINLNPDFYTTEFKFVTPIKVFKDGDVLMQWGHKFLFYYSNKTKTSQEIRGVFYRGCPDIYPVLFTPSFLSLKRFGMENVKPLKCSFLDKIFAMDDRTILSYFLAVEIIIIVAAVLAGYMIDKFICGP